MRFSEFDFDVITSSDDEPPRKQPHSPPRREDPAPPHEETPESVTEKS
jgi:hypothetical protein